LRPGGLLVVAVPNRHSHLFNRVYAMLKGGAPPLYRPGAKELHLFHFTPRSLGRLVQASGFAIVKAGLDLPDADWRKRWVDRMARGWFHLTGVNGSMAICMVAERPGGR
jgi:hypothetical protein